MRSGYWWALLVLAAVFTMHGLQCAAGETAAPSTGVSAAGAAQVQQHHVAPAATARSATTADAGHTALPAPAPASPHEPQDHSAAHVWTVCLAVLAAGLAALAAALGRRLTPVLPPAAARLRPGLRALVTALRPPDLHALCILRT